MRRVMLAATALVPMLEAGRQARADITKFVVPGATATAAYGINARGQVVGYYQDASSNFHGFVKEGARFTTFDVPGNGGRELGRD